MRLAARLRAGVEAKFQIKLYRGLVTCCHKKVRLWTTSTIKQSEAAVHQALTMPLALVFISRHAKCIKRQVFKHGDDNSAYQRPADPCAEREVLKPISVTTSHRLFDFGEGFDLSFVLVVNCSTISRHHERSEGGSVLRVENPSAGDVEWLMSSRHAVKMES